MIAVARREYPGIDFGVGSMTDLPPADASVGGLLAWWSLIHVPDREMPGVLAQFRRVLRPGAPLLVAFNLGAGETRKTEGYGGHPMRLSVFARTPEQLTAWLHEAGFRVEIDLRLEPEDPRPGAALFAR
jgi:ubiquinone/menaquinone biosynthesis C-methylase UbiE